MDSPERQNLDLITVVNRSTTLFELYCIVVTFRGVAALDMIARIHVTWREVGPPVWSSAALCFPTPAFPARNMAIHAPQCVHPL